MHEAFYIWICIIQYPNRSGQGTSTVISSGLEPGCACYGLKHSIQGRFRVFVSHSDMTERVSASPAVSTLEYALSSETQPVDHPLHALLLTTVRN